MDPVAGIYKQQIRSKSFCITPGQLSEADLSSEAKGQIQLINRQH